ncbi:MAG: hypothetical protein ABIL68_08040 [bacterium]
MRFSKVLSSGLCIFLLLGSAAVLGQDFHISALDQEETQPATAYNFLNDEFLVV